MCVCGCFYLQYVNNMPVFDVFVYICIVVSPCIIALEESQTALVTFTVSSAFSLIPLSCTSSS